MWQIALDYVIDPAEGVELVELPESVIEFEKQVVIKSPKKTLEKAKKDCQGLVIWTDRSKLDQGNVGAAACWKDKACDKWKKQSVFLGKKKKTLNAELWAILKALEVALKVLGKKEAPVTIFCNSQKVVRTIQSTTSCNESQFLRNLINHKAGKLQCDGYLIAIRWIPSHSRLKGNKKADLAAKTYTQRRERQAEKWSSLAYIKKNLNGIRAKEFGKWYQTQTEKRKASCRDFYVPYTKNGINSTLENAPKKYASWFYQLKVGHAAVETFLARIRVIKAPKCWWCGEEE